MAVKFGKKTFQTLVILNQYRTQVVNTNNKKGYVLASTTHIIKTDLNGDVDGELEDLYMNGSAILDINNIQTYISAEGHWFGDGDDAYYRLKNNNPNQASTIFAGGLWFRAQDINNLDKLAQKTYDLEDSGLPARIFKFEY